jgi:hypothetical protein
VELLEEFIGMDRNAKVVNQMLVIALVIKDVMAVWSNNNNDISFNFFHLNFFFFFGK